jgi:membrane associated rhomboid family serine protease
MLLKTSYYLNTAAITIVLIPYTIYTPKYSLGIHQNLITNKDNIITVSMMKSSKFTITTTLTMILLAVAATMTQLLLSTTSVVHASAVHGYSIQPIMSPGRRYRSRGYNNRRPREPRQMTREEYESHFLDDDNWMTDKKVRLWDTQRRGRRPNDYSWTSRLIGTNIATFFLQTMNPRVTGWGVKISDKILKGQDLYRLLSPVFLHGGFFHLMTNMYSLSNIGPMAEQVFGPGRFLATFLVSGITGNLLSAYQSPNPALGASGAVFGIMASLYVFLNRNDWILGAQGEAYQSSITQTLLINLFIGAVSPMM